MNTSNIFDQDYQTGTTIMPEPYMVIAPNPGMYIELFNGRKTPDEVLDDWGTEGPIFGPLQHVHSTYATDVKLGFEDATDGRLLYVDDCVYYDGVYYGDINVFYVDSDPFAYGSRFQEFKKELAIPPPTREVKQTNDDLCEME